MRDGLLGLLIILAAIGFIGGLADPKKSRAMLWTCAAACLFAVHEYVNGRIGWGLAFTVVAAAALGIRHAIVKKENSGD